MNTKKILTYKGETDLGLHKYEDESGKIYVDVDMSADPRKPSGLHTISGYYGEPEWPVEFEFEVVGWSDEQQLQYNFKFEYMMLSSRKAMLKYNLENGNKEKCLDLLEQIREYFAKVPVKPEWITEEQIKEFEMSVDKIK